MTEMYRFRCTECKHEWIFPAPTENATRISLRKSIRQIIKDGHDPALLTKDGRDRTHGRGSYNVGCRCKVCRNANMSAHARRRKAINIPLHVPHGSRSTYSNWGCRCGPCSEANALACAEYKERRDRNGGKPLDIPLGPPIKEQRRLKPWRPN
ncbi:hypothetical protein SEA_FORZA_31 [Gordonia phage Forza]|uniref:Uncharacterized protein n=1 Tax=Gordonia phage Forza TaxID=2571247 RepID=A0A650EY91_9CAUD|nr:hypothetical protein PP303_gp031 [Gordonia phage Forza]QEM41501.1 hypothetical protein SEA_BOOPY_32 [Gordonia phage Boopy]QGT55024.1 hypothetical protein SEA_FORZA_31 [Gordonia phage Forza]UXE04174.1 hypothetical protein SEA_BLUENGOLD_30 [Gordonia phage BlueNGold]WBF03813.1 hypothetical protein SEA_MAREELIH_30 [Gordonia phage Mareelih]